MNKKLLCFSIGLLGLLMSSASAQDGKSGKRLNTNFDKEFVYSSSWAGQAKLRSDGWQVGAEYSKYKTYAKTTIFQFDLGLYKHPKQARQSKNPYGGWFNSNGIKPFSYGKTHTLFTLHGAVGQKFLLAEQAKRNGVMIQYYYAGGLALGFLKPYYLRVCGDDLCTFYEEVTYEKGIDNNFTNYDYIVGGAGFGKGWKLKFRPGVHFKTGMAFDWSNQDNIIKAVDVGISVDSYFSKLPMMFSKENKFIFVNAFVGFTMGKKK